MSFDSKTIKEKIIIINNLAMNKIKNNDSNHQLRHGQPPICPKSV